MFHLLRLGSICTQPGQHLYRFKGGPGETAEEWGGACMGLHEPYNAIWGSSWMLETTHLGQVQFAHLAADVLCQSGGEGDHAVELSGVCLQNLQVGSVMPHNIHQYSSSLSK